ncbi:colicin E3/pyocin S6 family cytotoxin [Sphaerisporangium rubeum]|uniref:colicin E3/pyocin S6 family cytotoxin n=1 Tax=Sphaerisporangium rubeum TaxID=321317 RepID=UPI00161360D5
MTIIPWPRTGFLARQRRLGAPNGRMRWQSLSGDEYYEWDSQHGHVEVYNKRGRHIGVLDCEGVVIGKPVQGRRIDV